jgi:hypothetical protein
MRNFDLELAANLDFAGGLSNPLVGSGSIRERTWFQSQRSSLHDVYRKPQTVIQIERNERIGGTPGQLNTASGSMRKQLLFVSAIILLARSR